MTVYDITIFGIHLTIRPVAFSIPLGSRSWDVYWYGIIIAVGFLLALVYGMKNAPRFGLNTDRILDVVLVATPVAILSARTFYVIFDGVPLRSFADFFGFGDSSGFAGLAIYGGVIGAFVSGAVMCRLRGVNILDMFDLAVLGFLIGQGIGRWGNFVNQEAYGGFTGSSWWGMQSNRTIQDMGEGMVHPCFLYESIWCIAGFFLLHHFSKKRAFKGQIALMYGVWYGFGRGWIELLRTDSLMAGAFKISDLISFILCPVCLGLLLWMRARMRTAAAESTYNGMFAEQLESDGGETEAAEETAEPFAEAAPEENEEETGEDVQTD